MMRMMEKNTKRTLEETLTLIAYEVVSATNQSAFVTKMAEAWLIADSENRKILTTPWSAVISKYHLVGLIK